MTWTKNDLRAHLFKARQGMTFNEWHHWVQVNRTSMWTESGLPEKEFGEAVEAASMDVFNSLKDLRFPKQEIPQGSNMPRPDGLY